MENLVNIRPTYPLIYATVIGICHSVQGYAAALDEVHNYVIQSQPLSDALTEFADQSNLKLVVNPELTKDFKSPTIKEELSIEAGLNKILKNTGLSYRLINNNVIIIESLAKDSKSEGDVTTLPKVKVVGNAAYDAKDPYNKGYVLPNATSGTKTDTPIMETPLNVQVISKQVLKDQQVINIDQALRNVSGVYTDSRDNPNSNSGLGTNLYLRGFATTTYFRNGFRIDNPSGSSLGLSDRQFANVESVEVLKGSSAILYGRVEPGGMVNVITKQPLSKPYYSLTQQFGSYNTNRTSLDVSGPITQDDTLLYRLNMSYQNQGSFRDNVNNENFFIAPIVKWNINSRTQATLEMEYQHDTASQALGLVPAFNGQLISIPYSRNYYNPSAINVQDTYFVGFNWSHQFNDDWSIKHRFQFNKNDLTQFNAQNATFTLTEINNQPILNFNNVANPGSVETDSTGLDLTGHFDTGLLKHTLLFGGDYYRYTLNSQFIDQGTVGINLLNPVYPGTFVQSPNPGNNYNSDNKIDNYGLYLQDQIELPQHVHLLGGMRYQYVHEIFNFLQDGTPIFSNPVITADAITPRGGLLWNPEPWISLYTNYTEGFGVNAGKTPNGNGVPPTSSRQYEGGIKTEFFDGRLRTTLSYYDLTKTNIATASPDQNLANQGFSAVVGAANSHGPELDIIGEIMPGWNVIANYTNMNVHITKSNDLNYLTNYDGSTNITSNVGSRFNNVPRNIAKVWSTYELQEGDLKGLKLGGGVTMQDSLNAGSNGTTTGATIPISGYATVSLMSGYSFKVHNTKITTQLNIENLLDKHYYTGGVNYVDPVHANNQNTAYSYTNLGFGTPRTIMGSINIEY